jgi:hypothetical protein
MAEKFEHWGIVELMGHQRAAGRLTEESVAGSNLLRVDIPTDTPSVGCAGNFRTAYYGSSAIYALHITTEEVARTMALRSGARPPFAYEIQRLPPITSDDDLDRDDELL